jgi:hypothetical protein
MSTCPYCGSEKIQVIRDSKINWTRAAVGHIVYGPVGAALGSVTGKSRFANYCLDCGKHWDQSGLVEVVKEMERIAKCKLDLTQDGHRMALAKFSEKREEFERKFKIAKNNISIKHDYISIKDSSPQVIQHITILVVFSCCFALAIQAALFGIKLAGLLLGTLLFVFCLLPVVLLIGYFDMLKAKKYGIRDGNIFSRLLRVQSASNYELKKQQELIKKQQELKLKAEKDWQRRFWDQVLEEIRPML